MNCPRCGKSIPAGAAFCMFCGTKTAAVAPVGASAAPAAVVSAGMVTGLTQAYAAQKRRNATAAVVVLILAVGFGAALGLRGHGLLLSGERASSSGLRAAGSLPGPALQKIASTGPSGLQKAAENVGMPKDVEDWLEHLRETERRKRILTQRQAEQIQEITKVAELGVGSVADVNELTDPDTVLDKAPAQKTVHDLIADLKPAWYRLNDFFMSVPAPPECVNIAGNYSSALSQIGDQMGDLDDIVQSLDPMSPDLNSDVAAKKKDVYQIQQTHRQTIDESFKKALFGVDEVCRKYNKTRWFDIDTSGNGSNILGAFMGG